MWRRCCYCCCICKQSLQVTDVLCFCVVHAAQVFMFLTRNTHTWKHIMAKKQESSDLRSVCPSEKTTEITFGIPPLDLYPTHSL